MNKMNLRPTSQKMSEFAENNNIIYRPLCLCY